MLSLSWSNFYAISMATNYIVHIVLSSRSISCDLGKNDQTYKAITMESDHPIQTSLNRIASLYIVSSFEMTKMIVDVS